MPVHEPEVQARIDQRRYEESVKAAKAQGASEKLAHEVARDTENAIKMGRLWGSVFNSLFNPKPKG
jgi:hypothetical protein